MAWGGYHPREAVHAAAVEAAAAVVVVAAAGLVAVSQDVSVSFSVGS